MPTVPPSSTASRAAQPRLLSGAGRGDTRTATATGATSFTATMPANRPQAARPSAAEPGLPRWLKGVVIGGVLLAVGMPVTVLISRSLLVQEALAEQSSSKAAMTCTAGDGRAVDDSSIGGWLFGGSYFQCGDWETREARVQRERAQYEANYLARERSRRQGN